MNIDLQKIEELAQLLEKYELAEIEVTEGEMVVRIASRHGAPSVSPVHLPAPPALSGTTGGVPPASSGGLSGDASEYRLTSPMVGTFYRSNQPGSPPFVDVGSSVKVGDVLCIVEAMKLMNEVHADQAGVVERILAENGKPVEYGQSLMVIRA